MIATYPRHFTPYPIRSTPAPLPLDQSPWPEGDLLLEGKRRLFRREINVSYGGLMSNEGSIFTALWQERKATPLVVLASWDRTVHGYLLHASLSYRSHLPSWRDLRDVRDALLPKDRDFMSVFPRPEDYVNLQEFTLHLWECPTKWGIQ
jgi:hypothetical protein